MSLADPKAEEQELERLGQILDTFENDSEVMYAFYKLHKCRILRFLMMLTVLCLTAILSLKKLPLEQIRPKILTAQK